MQGVDLGDISMLPSGVGWIGAGAHAYQYDGAAWNERSTGLGAVTIARISAVGVNDAWATTSSPNCVSYSQILHWDGSQWIATLPPNMSYDIDDIDMAGPSDGWAVGYDCSSTGLLLHYDGTNWTPVPGPGDPGLSYFWRVWAGPPGDAWLVASTYNNTRRSICHYDHGVWTSWTLPVGTDPYAIFMANDGEGWVGTAQGIYHWDGTAWLPEYTGGYWLGLGGAAGQVWAAGNAGAIFTRSAGSGWTQQAGSPTLRNLTSVSALSLDDAWAVGDGGTILHEQNGSWIAVTSPITADLAAVQMLSPTPGYAVGGAGSSGLIARWDGVTWSQVATTTAPLYGLSMTGPGSGWAVGAGGAIWQAVGEVWSQVASPTQYDLRAVAMDSATHGWAVGGGIGPRQSVLLEYSNTTWVDQTALLPPTDRSLLAIALASGGQQGFALTGDSRHLGSGVLLRLSNHTWTIDTSTYKLSAIAFDSNGTAWAVGLSPTALHYTGGTWQSVALPIGWLYPLGNPGPSGLALDPGQGGWAVGLYGQILRYDAPAPPASPTPPVSPSMTATPSALPSATATSTPSSTLTSTPTTTSTPTSTPSITPSPTYMPSHTPTNMPIATPPETNTPQPTPTPSPSSTPEPPSATALPPSPTACPIQFGDVQPADYFYTPVLYLACHGTLSGYADGTFRPYNQTTRAQMVKIVVLGFALPLHTPPAGDYTFTDVPPAQPFFAVIETAASRGIVSGYACGGPGEPCDAQRRPYFRPNNNVTRGQLAKIVVATAAWSVITPAVASFADVPPGSAFYEFVETAYCHTILSGYGCGGPGEPCDGQRRPYFRPANPAARGQIAKIVYGALTDVGSCPSIPRRQ